MCLAFIMKFMHGSKQFSSYDALEPKDYQYTFSNAGKTGT